VKGALKPFTAFQGSALSACFQRLLKADLEANLASSGHASQVQNVAVAVQPVTPALDVGGDGQAGFSATVTATASGVQQSVYFEDVIVRVGRALDTFSYENDSSPVSDTEASAVAASVSRLQTALGG
jgi:hypothetical protein